MGCHCGAVTPISPMQISAEYDGETTTKRKTDRKKRKYSWNNRTIFRFHKKRLAEEETWKCSWTDRGAAAKIMSG